MSLHSSFFDFVTADVAVAALMDDRIVPVQAPQDIERPYVVYRRQKGGERDYPMVGPADGVMPLYRLSAYAFDYDEVRRLIKALIDAVNGFKGPMGDVTVRNITVLDDWDTPLKNVEETEFCSEMDMTIWLEEEA